VWIDYRELRPDRAILMQLDTAIRRCHVFVAVRRRSSAPSAWVRKELLIARAYEKRVVQFTLAPLTPHAFELKLQCLCRALATLAPPHQNYDEDLSRLPRVGLTSVAKQLGPWPSSSAKAPVSPVAGLRMA
jgi:hypothetical protein